MGSSISMEKFYGTTTIKSFFFVLELGFFLTLTDIDGNVLLVFSRLFNLWLYVLMQIELVLAFKKSTCGDLFI